MRLHCDEDPQQVRVELHIGLPSGYPREPPSISVRSNEMSRLNLADLRTLLIEAAEKRSGEAMLMDIVSLASENLQRILDSNVSSSLATESLCSRPTGES